MTENYPPPLVADDYLQPPPATTAPLTVTPAMPASDQPTTTDVAKERAAAVGQGAADAGQHVAAVAKDQVVQVSAEAGRQVKDLVSQAQGQLAEQAGVQQQKLVSGLQSLRDELTSMAQNADQPGVGSDLARQAAERTGNIAGWLDGREPAALLDDVTTFARRRPGAFLAIAGGIGLLAGRLTRGIKAQPDASAAPEQAATTPLDARPQPTPYPGPQAAPLTPPAPAVGLSEPLSPPIVPDFSTPGYLGDAR